MKTTRRVIFVLPVLSMAVVIIYAVATMPLKYYDEQGARITAHLGSKNIEAYHSGHSYLSLTGWREGSDILVYGIQEAGQFPEIAKEIEAQNPATDIWVEFYSGTHDAENRFLKKLKISK
jgi:hypothetical protein